MKHLQNVINHHKRGIQREAEELLFHCDSLTNTIRKVKDIINKKEYASINPLGELQRTAQDFDRLCAMISTRQNMIDDIESNVEES